MNQLHTTTLSDQECDFYRVATNGYQCMYNAWTYYQNSTSIMVLRTYPWVSKSKYQSNINIWWVSQGYTQVIIRVGTILKHNDNTVDFAY